MSQLWPELLRITLCPDQVVLERGKLIISLKGMEERYFEPELIPVEARHEPTLWSAPLDVLAIALDGLPERRHDTHVILSNHFVHYPLVNAGQTEEADNQEGMVDPQLEATLTALLIEHGCKVLSIEPRVVAMATHYPDELQGEPGWLVLIEEGLACLALIEDGEFIRLRHLYMWPASSVELLSVLDREADLAGLGHRPRTLLLWTRDDTDEVCLPANLGWHVSHLGKAAPPSLGRPLARAQQAVGMRV